MDIKNNNIAFLRNVESFQYRDATRFSAKTELLFSQEMWMHFCLDVARFLAQTEYVFLRNVESSLYRNDSTFFKNTIFQSGPKIWLHHYIEMIPHFLRKQCFHIKCVLFRQCNLYGINSISVIDATLWIHLQLGKASLYRVNCIGQAE